MKYVRHQPGYTPEKAAQRRNARELARRHGYSPRQMKAKLRKVMATTMRNCLSDMLLRDPLLFAYASGGVFKVLPWQGQLIDRMPSDYVIPRSRVADFIAPTGTAERQDGKASVVTVHIGSDLPLSELTPEQEELLEKVRPQLREWLDRRFEAWTKTKGLHDAGV